MFKLVEMACPNCGADLKKKSVRIWGCPHCGADIYVKYGQKIIKQNESEEKFGIFKKIYSIIKDILEFYVWGSVYLFLEIGIRAVGYAGIMYILYLLKRLISSIF